MRIIGFVGPKGSGKSTAAGILAEVLDRHGVGLRQLGFADPIKLAASSLGFDIGSLYGPSEHRNWMHPVMGVTTRRFCQLLGEAIRKENPAAWVNMGIETASTVLRRGSHTTAVAFTDLRMPEEVNAIRHAGGLVIYVQRPDLVSTDGDSSETWAASQDAIAASNYLVVNDTLARLTEWLETLVHNILQRGW